jgi:hypothetical protein
MKVVLIRLWSSVVILVLLVALNPFGRHLGGPITTGSIPSVHR